MAESDFETFDKNVRSEFRAIETGALTPYFPIEEKHIAMLALKALDRKFKIRHVNGWRVELPGSQRWSGEPMTSIGNGLINHFITWVAAGEPPLLSWNEGDVVSYHEGDDAIVGSKTQIPIAKTAKDFGMIATVDWFRDMDLVKFCGRYTFPNTTLGPLSVCGIWRALNKFHLTARPTSHVGTRESLLAAKCLSYMCTDYRTPVVGAVAWALFQHVQHVECRKDFTWIMCQKSRYSPLTMTDRVADLKRLPAPLLAPDVAGLCALAWEMELSDIQKWHTWWVDYGSKRGPYPPPFHNQPHKGAVNRMVV